MSTSVQAESATRRHWSSQPLSPALPTAGGCHLTVSSRGPVARTDARTGVKSAPLTGSNRSGCSRTAWTLLFWPSTTHIIRP